MAGGDEVKLLGSWASPFTLRARIALNLKGIDYEFLQETLSSKSELLLSSNPVYKKVPVLIHNSKPICESTVILHYIDEAWPDSGPAILPSDPHHRAVARFWAVYLNDKWLPALREIVMARTEEGRVEAVDQVFAGMPLLEEAFEKCSNGRRFFGGDTIGYLDIALGGHLGWVRATEEMMGVRFLDEGKTPLLVGWAERFFSEASVKGVMPEIDKLVEYGKKIQLKVRAAASVE